MAHAFERKTANRLTSKIKELLDVFKASWEFSSGYSMEILWSMFAPPTATNGRELDLVVRLEIVADLFDIVMWQSKIPLDMLAELRSSIVRLDPLEQQADRNDEQNLSVSQKTCLDLTCFLNVDRQSRRPWAVLRIVWLYLSCRLTHTSVLSLRAFVNIMLLVSQRRSQKDCISWISSHVVRVDTQCISATLHLGVMHWHKFKT